MTSRQARASAQIKWCLRLATTLSLVVGCGGKLEGEGARAAASRGGEPTSGDVPVGIDSGAICNADPNAVLVRSIAIGGKHICILTVAGGVRCWGNNEWGQLGDDSDVDRATLPNRDVLSGVSAIAAGYVHTCALLEGGGVRCWGGNDFGQLGNGQSGRRANLKVPPDSDVLTGISEIGAGYGHTCARTNTAQVYCWGVNDYSQLGDGTLTSLGQSRPERSVEGLQADTIAVGAHHNCAMTHGEPGVWCWGADTTNPSAYSNWKPWRVDGLDGASRLVAGELHSCALVKGGFRCWGKWALTVVVRDRLTDIAAGSNHTCALIEGDVYCWGNSELGQLGDASLPTPWDSPVLRGAIAIFAGGSVTCALTNHFGVRCWGDNSDCQSGRCGRDDLPCRVDGASEGYCLTPAVPDGLCRD